MVRIKVDLIQKLSFYDNFSLSINFVFLSATYFCDSPLIMNAKFHSHIVCFILVDIALRDSISRSIFFFTLFYFCFGKEIISSFLLLFQVYDNKVLFLSFYYYYLYYEKVVLFIPRRVL